VIKRQSPFAIPAVPTLAVRNDGDIGMGSAAIALVMLGFVVGAVFRLKMLLLILALLLVVSIVFSVNRGFSFLDTALTIMAAQSIVQASYFLGLLARAVVTAAHRMRPIL
jgi:ABC-type iron transport system FetAB permease component